ncbi:enoyl-CoA hydratase/isomerase domain-containing protein [Hirsutella rhossiliensis]|uniref:Enoyl-CoA hydratase/isomerase domain-containing protein n=1 Tax=Hirsutella rhossiliensis TaxID=111463 RepID=A0A9P8SGH5_9HYPO|nr:enoyl-CoA hydratase/isomerase domain-containing protein [Hirsutella rhossiliensis]KAH0961129.1 enoyl-CoA hydratase/isomerase domain-containing protein [Hirsutella rhossiliensis]
MRFFYPSAMPSSSSSTSSSQPALSQPPPPVSGAVVAFPRPHVLLVTLDRPRQLNALTHSMHAQLDRLWAWFDAEPSLRCAVVTGSAGGRAFSAGADLKEWNARNSSASSSAAEDGLLGHGFGGLSNRRGRKPVVAAVNGLCLGGAVEMVLNADLVVAAAGARFGLPEVGVGVVAVAGGLPRLARIVGRQRASEMALLGSTRHTAAQMREWGIVNKVVGDGGGEAQAAAAAVVEEALRWAERVAANSPDAVMVTREGLLGAWEAEDPRASTRRVGEGVYARMEGGENMREGIASFVERRKPVWKDSKL